MGVIKELKVKLIIAQKLRLFNVGNHSTNHPICYVNGSGVLLVNNKN